MPRTSGETDPLLPAGSITPGRNSSVEFVDQSKPPLAQRFLAFIRAEGEPGWSKSFRFFFFGSYMNVLLVFVPLSFLSHFLNWDAPLRFSFSFVAIMPLAQLLGVATDEMSCQLGDTLAGLLNASFGNAVEIIVGIAALLQDQLRIVQTSMLGSVISNILLVMGCSFLAAGIKERESKFQVTAAQASSSLMTLACITLIIPAAFFNYSNGKGVPGENIGADTSSTLEVVDIVDEDTQHGLLLISRGTALLLLGVYVAYLYFQLVSHKALFVAPQGPADTLQSGRPDTGNLPQNGERGDGTAQQQEISTHATPDGSAGQQAEEPSMSTVAASIALLGTTVVTSCCADYLVGSIEETAKRYHIPKPFIGLILLPLVANAAEHVTSVWMALKGKMELTIGICVGSSIQIATFVLPLMVIIGWMTNHDLTLFFANFETVVFFVSVFLVNTLIQDGKSNYMEGVMLITLYIVIALAFWVS